MSARNIWKLQYTHNVVCTMSDLFEYSQTLDDTKLCALCLRIRMFGVQINKSVFYVCAFAHDICVLCLCVVNFRYLLQAIRNEHARDYLNNCGFYMHLFHTTLRPIRLAQATRNEQCTKPNPEYSYSPPRSSTQCMVRIATEHSGTLFNSLNERALVARVWVCTCALGWFEFYMCKLLPNIVIIRSCLWYFHLHFKCVRRDAASHCTMHYILYKLLLLAIWFVYNILRNSITHRTCTARMTVIFT